MMQDRVGPEFDMKDISLMLSFLGLEVWKGTGEVFHGQGMYGVEILKRFEMMDCKPLGTHMISNLKLSADSDIDFGRAFFIWLVD
jgi:hypothetical protein